MPEKIIDGNVNQENKPALDASVYEKQIAELIEENAMIRAQVDRIYNELQRYQQLYFTTGLNSNSK